MTHEEFLILVNEGGLTIKISTDDALKLCESDKRVDAVCSGKTVAMTWYMGKAMGCLPALLFFVLIFSLSWRWWWCLGIAICLQIVVGNYARYFMIGAAKRAQESILQTMVADKGFYEEVILLDQVRLLKL